jgi:hypothetical protein
MWIIRCQRKVHARRGGRGRLTTTRRATCVASARLTALVALGVMIQRQRVMVISVCGIAYDVAGVRLGLGVESQLTSVGV